MGDVELLALYWTVSGPVEVHVGREWSLFEWRDRCAQAARVGFSGLGLWHSDIEHQLESSTLREMKQIFDDAGLKYLQVEFLADFFAPDGSPERAESDERRTLLLETAAEQFAALCQDAAAVTSAPVAYEFMPFDVNVNTLDTALSLVQDADQPNGGLAIDTWHMSKLGISPDDLRRIPQRYLTWVELSDGQFVNMDDPIDEVVNHRQLPGEGEFDIPAYVEVCRQIGYAGPWGVEVLSEALRNLPIEEEFDRAYETTIAQFGAGVARGPGYE